MAENTPLKPCPHCGCADIRAETNKDDFENSRFEVSCSGCGAAIGWHVDSQPWGDDLDAKEDATIAAWNRRVSMAPLHLVFTAFPGPGNECVFVESETPEGKSYVAGEWQSRPDGLVELVIPAARSTQDAETIQALEARLTLRDTFIAEKGLWHEFAATVLPSASEPAS